MPRVRDAATESEPGGEHGGTERLVRVIEATLAPEERLRAVAALDLDARLVFGDLVLALTTRRLLSCDVREGAVVVFENALEDVVELLVRDHGGLGIIEARGRSRLLGRWSFTLSRLNAVKALADAFDQDLRERGASRGQMVSAAASPASAEALAHKANAIGDGDGAPNGGPRAESSENSEGRARAVLLFRLLQFVRPHLRLLIAGFILTVATTVVGLIPPYLTWPLVDQILVPYQNEVGVAREAAAAVSLATTEALAEVKAQARGAFGRVPLFLLGMLAAAVAAWALAWAQGWVLARLGERISADLRNTTYAHLQALSLDFFTSRRTGDIVSRVSSDTDRICSFLSDTLMDFSTDVLMIVGAAGMLFYMDPVLAVGTLSTFPLVAWLTLLTRRHLRQGFLFGSRAWAEMTSILADTIPGVRVVKAFAQEQREVERFRRANDRIVAANDRVNRLWTFFWPMVVLLNQFGLLVAWAIGAWRVYEQEVTVGVLTAFLAYIGRFYSRLESMTRMSAATQRAAASAERIFEILDRRPSVPDPLSPERIEEVRGEIVLDRVSFRFGSRKVLSDVSLHIRPGEMVGLVGPTGGGKSTLINLVCRFYDASDGAVLVDGRDLRSFRVADYRRHIGLVLQEPFLFYGTIAENIAYGRRDATRGAIIEAARAARAHEFILKLPGGYDAMVGERGQTLSGGERQRISIARAILIDPRILILDEATSSVDTETERQIQEALEELVRGRTTIAVAHRLSTLRRADRIIVLGDGRIRETGRHEDLLAAGGLYARLHEAQRRQAIAAPPEEGSS